jgi:IS5 family transposase
MLTFHHLQEKHQVIEKLFGEVNRYLALHWVTPRSGTLVDAKIIDTSPLRTRMSLGWVIPGYFARAKLLSYWDFGIKACIIVAEQKCAQHRLETNTAKVHESHI